MVDYPGLVSSVVYVGRCNFRCGFCHNPDLVLNPDDVPTISEQEVIGYLSEKRKWLDGLCITGGEPMLHDLRGFIGKVKAIGLKVKVDTNGSFPGRIAELRDIVDFFAMDIKGPLEKYNEICRCNVDVGRIRESIAAIMGSGIDYEFRTTCVPGLHEIEDFHKIGELIKGAKKYALQNFSNKGDMIDNSYKGIEPFSFEDMDRIKAIMENYVDKVELRR